MQFGKENPINPINLAELFQFFSNLGCVVTIILIKKEIICFDSYSFSIIRYSFKLKNL